MPTPESPADPSPEAVRARARRGLLWFGLGVLLASAPLEAVLLRSGEPFAAQPRLMLALVFVPGAVSLLARLTLREGFDDISLRVSDRRSLLTAWALPVAMLALAYGAAWATGLARFQTPGGVPASMGAGTAFALSLGFALVQGTVFTALGAAGEELGWRGYLLTRLVDAGVKRPVLASALAWAAWQLPLVVSGRYGLASPTALSATLFVVGLVAHAYVLAKLRLSSGSVWPAIIYRASWAAQLEGTFEAFARGDLTPARPSLWTGEAGALVVAGALALALLYTRHPWPLRRTPRARPAGSLGLGDA